MLIQGGLYISGVPICQYRMVLLSEVHSTRSCSCSTSILVVVLLSGVHCTRSHSCSSSILVVVLLSGVHCTRSHSCNSSILVVVLLSGVHSTRSHCCSILVVVFLSGVHSTRSHSCSCSILVVVVICLSHLFTFLCYFRLVSSSGRDLRTCRCTKQRRSSKRCWKIMTMMGRRACHFLH